MLLTRSADEKAVFINEEQLRATEGEAGRYPLRVRSLDLNDELGQISHIFRSVPVEVIPCSRSAVSAAHECLCRAQCIARRYTRTF